MDGLSVAANVIAVLQVANSVISICYDFRAALKKSPWALTRVLDEITDLRGILEAIERVSTADTQLPNSKLLVETCNLTHGPLSTCMAALNHLEGLLGSSTLGNSTISRWRALSQAVTWQFKDKEITGILETVDRCKNTLKLAVSTEEWYATVLKARECNSETDVLIGFCLTGFIELQKVLVHHSTTSNPK